MRTTPSSSSFFYSFYKKFHRYYYLWNLTTPRVGFEPTTLRLTAECSTTELSRNSSYNYFSITYLFGIWQPLTFPGSFPPSIISRLCLNQPVRNGKGCVPQTHHHQKFLKAFFIPSKLNIEYHHLSSFVNTLLTELY